MKKRSSSLRLVGDLFARSARDRKYVLIPVILLLLILAGILIFVTISGPLAPFIYPLV